MEALQFSYNKKKLELAQLPIPKIKETFVLVKVAFAGICGTDLHIIRGDFPCSTTKPITLGHELSGTVLGTGEHVRNVRKGDKVTVNPNNGCHNCNACHIGNPHFCQTGGLNNTIGIFRDGGWADYVLVPEEQIFKLPEGVSLEQGALCEPLSCLAHGWDLLQPLPVGRHILILGAGIIGNLLACILHLQGHRNVTISEPNVQRLQQIHKLKTGFKLVTPEELSERTPEFDVIVDCTGYAPAMEHALKLLNYGGKLCIFGVAPPHAKFTISPFDIFKRELTIFGVTINPFTFPKAIGLVEALGERYLNYDNLGIRTFRLIEYKQAIEMLQNGNIAKAVFQF